jgi:hypothetical protein
MPNLDLEWPDVKWRCLELYRRTGDMLHYLEDMR